MSNILDSLALDQLFRAARTHYHWLEKPVSDEQLRQIYDLMKFGPTSMNMSPARIVFLRTPEAKQRLVPALSPGNVEKTLKAPVTAIIAHDLKFYEKLGELAPHIPNARNFFVNDPELTEVAAFRNGTLQGGYFILAARAVGLDCGPMSGFDNAKVDEEFFGAKENPAVEIGFTEGTLRSNFLCNLGYGDAEKLHPRNTRLSFEEACVLL